MLLRILLVANIFAIALNAANSTPHSKGVSSRIVGGLVATIEENPWLVYLSSECGGAIIGDKWIVTSAQCNGTFTVRAGSASSYSGGVVAKMKRFTAHEKYDIWTSDYDFALVELDEPLKFSQQIKAIALPDADTQFEDGTMCKVAGWGLTFNTSESNSRLRTVDLPLISQEYCQTRYKHFNVTDRMICAGYQNEMKNACYGDEGSALVDFEADVPRLVGLISGGLLCDQLDFPAVCSRITSVRGWIKSITGI